MTTEQRNAWRRFLRAAKRAGATRWQRGVHGMGRMSAQAFTATGKLVADWNLQGRATEAGR